MSENISKPPRILPLRQTGDGWWILTCHYSVVPHYNIEEASAGMSHDAVQRELELSWHASVGKRVYPEFGFSRHVGVEPLKFNPKQPLFCGWDWGQCYSDDTEVLTLKGWKLFKDVDIEVDLVATKNLTTQQLQYQKPYRKIENFYEGNMLEWSGRDIDLCVTPDHNIPCTLRRRSKDRLLLTAKQIATSFNRRYRIDATSVWVSQLNIDFEDKFGIFSSSASFAAFMGLYLSEGCVEVGKGVYRITIYQRERKASFEVILKETGLDWKWFEYGKTRGWRVTNRGLAIYLSSFGKAANKYVPEFIKAASPSVIMAFITAYTAGDGKICVNPRGIETHSIYTTSKRMADDIQELAQKVGWWTLIHQREEGVNIIKENGKIRHIASSKGYEICFRKTRFTIGLYHEHLKEIPYKGTVYCLTVPNGTLYVRRNGKPCWNGNCPAFVTTQINAHGQWLVFPPLAPSEEASLSVFEFSQMVVDHLQQFYASPNNMTVKQLRTVHYGDPAGAAPPARVGDSPKEVRSCFDIVKKGIEIVVGTEEDGSPRTIRRPGTGWTIKPGAIGIVQRLEAIKSRLRMGLKEGIPALVVDPRATSIIEGFNGLYNYKQYSDGSYDRNPTKAWISHQMNALEYVATRIFSHQPDVDEELDEDMRPSQPAFRSHAAGRNL